MTRQGAFRHLNISAKIEEGRLPARCDQHQLQQVIINLLLNSRDATPADGTITIRAGREGEHIRLDVIDTGTGISEADLTKIFDPFFTTKQPGKGTGLGLAISARIVEGFGGRITAVSKAGKGSCFSVRLPAASAEEEEAG